jgi:non-homologous end joining protein Ku
MARALIEEMSGEWEPHAQPNVYRKAIEKLIASKPKFELGEEKARGEPTPKVVDLMEALKSSLASGRKRVARTKPRKAARRAA